MKEDIPYDKIVKQIQKKASVEETEDLKVWLQQDENHKALYKKILKTWKIQKALHYKVNQDKAWIKLEDQLSLKSKSTLKVSYLRPIFQIAAVLILIIGLSFLFQDRINVWTENNLTLLAVNEQRTLILADGTEVFLNQNSELIYPEQFDEDVRKVRLKGEAFFKVKPNPNKPFYIETENSKTKVLGTSFNLRAYEHELLNKLTVTTGKVSFSSIDQQQEVILTPNQAGLLLVEKNELQKQAFIDPNYKAWLDKRFVFDNKSLEQVITTLNSAYSINIKIQDKHLPKEHLSTKFSALSVKEVLDLLVETIGFDYKTDDYQNIIILQKHV